MQVDKTVSKLPTVAVITPVYYLALRPEEQVSLQHLSQVLGRYDTFLIAPESLPVNWPGFEVKRFADEFFTNITTYSRLLLSALFYETFLDYDYILIYQLDCLVFSDQLLTWCQTGVDYVGAPWFWSKTDCNSGFSRVGNGGFSLRKVKSFLKVITSPRYEKEPVPFILDFWRASLPDLANLPLRQRLLKRIRVLREARRGVLRYLSGYRINEDHFWSDRARLFWPSFEIASVAEALRFSFERCPQVCLAQNGGQLPFGCHAWTKYDKRFWERYLLSR